jgi:hypothetical protein
MNSSPYAVSIQECAKVRSMELGRDLVRVIAADVP